MSAIPELKKIPDILSRMYPPSGTFSPVLVVEQPVIGQMSKRITRQYPPNYWTEGCILAKGEPHSQFQSRHVKCNIGTCDARFHSKFEIREHKRIAHAY